MSQLRGIATWSPSDAGPVILCFDYDFGKRTAVIFEFYTSSLDFDPDLDWPLCHGTGVPFDEHKRPLWINQSINQSIYLTNCATTKNECQQNNVKRSDGLPEKQIAHLSWSLKIKKNSQNKKFPKLLNYPKCICKNNKHSKPNPAMLQFVYEIISPRKLQKDMIHLEWRS